MFRNYNPKKENTSLFLHFSFNALSYAVYDMHQNLFTQFSVYKNLQTQIEWDSVFSNDPILRNGYSECKASFTNSLFSIIPNALYHESDYQTYLNFTVNEPDLYFKFSNILKDLEATIIYCVDRDPKIILNKYFPEATIYHSSIPIIKGLLPQPNNDVRDRLYLYTWNNHDLEIILIREGKLILYNHFFLNNLEEFLYYPLYICERLSLDRNQIEVLVGGTQNRSSKESSSLRPYFQHFSFLGIPNIFEYSHSISSVDNLGSIGSLAYLKLCE